MSHTTGNPTGALSVIPYTIVNYNAGGELISLSPDNPTSVQPPPSGCIIQGTIAANQNSLGVVLFATFANFVIRLYQMIGGALTEIPTTSGLNANVNLLVKVP